MEMPPEVNVAQIPEILEESCKSYSKVIERKNDEILMRIARALEVGETSTGDCIYPNCNDREEPGCLALDPIDSLAIDVSYERAKHALVSLGTVAVSTPVKSQQDIATSPLKNSS
ncbi:hypothetical protein PoB_000929700 [Plakobranchus ocellatus]|uniref:Uncharacterized protein n=1 Tax=Plakobranchus ocellatus TaxID=259542 RepID=A0AAV3YKV7_9GAST|nr:hypothetical protein PoB_000929700 [Plakobranchus ocellatus]